MCVHVVCSICVYAYTHSITVMSLCFGMLLCVQTDIYSIYHNVCVCVRVCVCVCVYIYTYVCVCVYTYMCVHIYITLLGYNDQ